MPDLFEAPLAIARAMGAAVTIEVASAPELLAEQAALNGGFDVAFEATGAVASPILSASFPLREVEAAFAMAGDRRRTTKAHLDFAA